jgi:enamine deaminase RidA (YjgF/YER057c/UK114 family)
MTFEVLNPESLGAPRGFSHGLLAPAGGRMLFVAGQSDESADAPPGFVTQFENALAAVLAVVRQAGGGPEHVGRMTIYVTDMARYRASLSPLGEAYRRHMGKHFPAMTLVEVKSLVPPAALVEIEATAVVP